MTMHRITAYSHSQGRRVDIANTFRDPQEVLAQQLKELEDDGIDEDFEDFRIEEVPDEQARRHPLYDLYMAKQ